MSFELLYTDEAVCLDKAPGDPEAKVVDCTSTQAAFQLVGKGAPISAEDAKRFGVKAKKADNTNYTLRIDSHTIARTPEEKAYAATIPQPGLQLARAEEIRQSAALSLASLRTADAAKAADAADDAKKADAVADKKIKATVEDKSAAKPVRAARVVKSTTAAKTTTAKAPKAPRAPRTSKKSAAAVKTEAEKTPATP